jgi:hypothetical protein
MKTTFLAICLSLNLAVVSAAPLFWTFEGVGSGALNGAPFANKTFTIFLTVDPTSVTDQPVISGSDVVWANVLLSTILVQDVGSGSFTYPLLVFDNSTHDGLGFSVDNSASGGFPGDMLDISAPQFATYGLTETLGPLNFASPTFFNGVYGTTMGYLDFGSMSSISFSVVTISEPSVLALSAIASAAFSAVYLSKRRPNKSLQATRDGRSSSASRFTSFGPACLSSGR